MIVLLFTYLLHLSIFSCKFNFNFTKIGYFINFKILMKLQLLLINAIDIEGFLYVNFIPVFILSILIGLFIYSYSTYFNFKYKCPKCSAVNDISRIKKNKIFKLLRIGDAYRKYSCGKCHNKFYIYYKNTNKSNKTKTT